MKDEDIPKLVETLVDQCWPDICRVRFAATQCGINAEKEPQCRDLFLKALVLPSEKAATITMPNPCVFYYNPKWTVTQTPEELAYAVERAAVIYIARMCGQYEKRYETMPPPQIVLSCMGKPIVRLTEAEVMKRREELSNELR